MREAFTPENMPLTIEMQELVTDLKERIKEVLTNPSLSEEDVTAAFEEINQVGDEAGVADIIMNGLCAEAMLEMDISKNERQKIVWQ